jgi:glucose-6-phosphate dehydrogenase assembly protein OpcA
MIVDLPNTTTSKVSKKIQSLREQGGVIALGRVLTLVVVTKSGLEEEAIEAANEASREHPCRIIVLADAGSSAPNRLDAQIRVGGDAGASEVIVLRGFGELAEESESLVAALLLPDAPIVAWWPHGAPKNASPKPRSAGSRTAGSPIRRTRQNRRWPWRTSGTRTRQAIPTWPGPG